MRDIWLAIVVFMLLWAYWQHGEGVYQQPVPQVVPGQHQAKDFIEIARAIAPSVVAVQATFDGGYVTRDHRKIGSGLIIDPEGLILTNRHLVEGASELEITLWDGRCFDARCYRLDPDMDIALLKIIASNLPAASLGSSSGLKVGQWAIACGNPFSPLLSGSTPAISVGIISGLNRNLAVEKRYFYRNLIQTDAAINLGNSGGPLLDLSGRVVGITTVIVSSSGASEGMGFAIPVDDIIPRLERLRKSPPRLRI